MKHKILTSDIFRSSIALSALFFGYMQIYAQTLHENVAVEGIFKPEVIRQERINVLPHRENFPIERQALSFDTHGVTASFRPTAMTMPVTGWRSIRPEHPRGYLDVSLGSWLNSSLSAGYSILRSEKTDLVVSLQHNSTSLWKPYKKELSATRFRYDESIAARFSHNFGSKGLLEASLDYHLGYFNYYNCMPDYSLGQSLLEEGKKYSAPTQTLNDFSLTAGWHASGRNSLWHACASMRYFGFRELYLPEAEIVSDGGQRESHINLDGGWMYKWDSGSSLGIEGSGDILLYGNRSHTTPLLVTIPATENYGQISLNPYYRFLTNNLIVRVGLNLDFTFNAQGDSEDSHYSLFHAAPDIRVDWRHKNWGAFINLIGGSELNTLSRHYQMTYYCMPALISTQPVYTPFDATLCVEFGPVAGFDAGLSVAFRSSKHISFAGWYPTLLRVGAYKVAPGLSGDEGSFAYGTNPQGYDLHGFSFALHASWQPIASLRISGNMTYQPQKGKVGYFNGLDRPRWTIESQVEYSPIKSLHLALGYDYRGVRNVYTTHTPPKPDNVTIGGEKRVEIVGLRLPDLTTLKAMVRYDINDRFSVGVKGYNLLNNRTMYLPGLPGEGIDLQGTFSILF